MLYSIKCECIYSYIYEMIDSMNSGKMDHHTYPHKQNEFLNEDTPEKKEIYTLRKIQHNNNIYIQCFIHTSRRTKT